MDKNAMRSALCCLSLAVLTLAVGSLPAHANVDLDRKYALESVGVLKAWDNVDGLFAEYVLAAYKEYFARQSRFVLQDLSKADPLLTNSKIPYNRLIEDPEVLGQLARSTRSQSMIRTRIQKEGAQYSFALEWLHAPDMEVMSRESFRLQEPRGGRGFGSQELKARLQQVLDKLIHNVPMLGSVTGRDNNAITLNIGANSGVEPGDTVVIGTLDQVKRHPLLKEVVEWRFSNTGRVTIEQVEDAIAFGKLTEEEPNHQVLRQQKVLEIQHHAASVNPASPSAPASQKDEVQLEEPPRLGFIAGGLNLGGFSRQYNSLDNTIGKDGGGFALGAKIDGQLWITREWFAELGLNYAFWNYSQSDTIAGSTGTSTSIGSSNLVGFKIAGGYSYLVNGDIFGPKGWARLGYRTNAYSLPASATAYSTPITFKSVFVGIGADIPIQEQTFGAVVDFNIGLLNSASESSKLSGDTDSASDVSFTLGGYYRYAPRITFRASLDIQANSADFKSGNTLSQKIITFVPAVLYYF